MFDFDKASSKRNPENLAAYIGAGPVQEIAQGFRRLLADADRAILFNPADSALLRPGLVWKEQGNLDFGHPLISTEPPELDPKSENAFICWGRRIRSESQRGSPEPSPSSIAAWN